MRWRVQALQQLLLQTWLQTTLRLTTTMPLQTMTHLPTRWASLMPRMQRQAAMGRMVPAALMAVSRRRQGVLLRAVMRLTMMMTRG